MYKNPQLLFPFFIILCHFIFTLNELNALVYMELPIKHYKVPSNNDKKMEKENLRFCIHM